MSIAQIIDFEPTSTSRGRVPTAQRLTLLKNGYMPIPVRGKHPAPKAWQKKTDTNAEDIELWEKVYPDATNTGILTRLTPAIDIDILAPDAAAAIEELVRERFEERGDILVRIGQAPKRAILLRTDTPFKKIAGDVIAPNGDTDQKIELLADGQQVVVFGMHPKTGKPYSWHGGDPSSVKHEDLPYVSGDDAKRFVGDAVARLIKEFGYTTISAAAARKAANGNGRARVVRLSENIKNGGELHDSLRDLAMSLLAKGAPRADVVTFLEEQMDRSTAPRDDRWRERRAEIPRLVDGAVKWLEERGAETSDAAGGDPDKILAEMNKQYAVVQIGGKTRVMGFEADPTYPGCETPVFQTFNDFRSFHNKHKILLPNAGGPATIGRGRWWLESPSRRQYDAVVYAPNVKTGTRICNLWRGFACEPREGDCSRYLEHMKNNVCRGNDEHYEYLLNKLAYGVQHPEKQGEVAVVLRGKEGVGKGKLVLTYGRLFGPHFKHISQPRHLVGNFNSLQQDCSVLFGDEVFFAGDRAHEGILKAIITEPTLQIERKGIDTITAPNRMHIFLSSNNAWVIPAGADARRFFILDVGDKHKQDFEYFAAIDEQMENGGLEALLHMLLNRDLSDFEVRRVPQTTALADQKQYSRRGIDALIEHVCSEGELFEGHGIYPNIAITSERDDHKGFFREAQSRFPDLKHTTWIVVSRALKEEWGCTPWKTNHLRGIQFPPLRELRDRFDKKFGAQDWERPDDDWWCVTGGGA
jgi:hypothetical protein